jgi:hypothetical protein
VSTLAYNQWTTASKDVQPYLAGLFGEALVRLLSHAHSSVQAEAARAIWSISYLYVTSTCSTFSSINIGYFGISL